MKKAILITLLFAVVIGTLSVTCIVLFSRDADGKKSELSTFDKYDYWTWFDDSDDNLISREDADKIKEGMTIEEVVCILGKPKRDVGSGITILEWDMESNEVLSISIVGVGPEKTVKLVRDNEEVSLVTCTDWAVDSIRVKPAK